MSEEVTPEVSETAKKSLISSTMAYLKSMPSNVKLLAGFLLVGKICIVVGSLVWLTYVVVPPVEGEPPKEAEPLIVVTEDVPELLAGIAEVINEKATASVERDAEAMTPPIDTALEYEAVQYMDPDSECIVMAPNLNDQIEREAAKRGCDTLQIPYLSVALICNPMTKSCPALFQ
tara:strand:+ start:1200 stop:1724 length:525 start_codon:yes stop_codon:yes gene_type:complete